MREGNHDDFNCGTQTGSKGRGADRWAQGDADHRWRLHSGNLSILGKGGTGLQLLGLPPNRGLRDTDGNLYDIVCGTFFLCGVPSDSDSFTSLTPEQFDHFQQLFRTPETFLRVNGKLVCLPLTDV